MPDDRPRDGRFSPLARLGVALTILGALWLGLFPLLAATPPAAAHIRTMQEGRVNPGAMFYSELDPPELVTIPFDTPTILDGPARPSASPAHTPHHGR